MTLNDLKLGLFNAITLTLSFSSIEMILKIILLLMSIVWTIMKIHESVILVCERRKAKKKLKDENNKQL